MVKIVDDVVWHLANNPNIRSTHSLMFDFFQNLVLIAHQTEVSTDLLVDNDCALTPDYVQLNCSVAYRGNFAPVLRWRHSAQLDIVVSTFTSQRQANSVATSILQLKPEFQMNGTYFICSVEEFVSESQSVTCLTQNLTVACKYYVHDHRIVKSNNRSVSRLQSPQNEKNQMCDRALD